MKNRSRMVKGLLALCVLFFSVIVKAQVSRTNIKGLTEPLRLGISSHKTTNLVFPFPIISVDRGSRDVLAQKPVGVENILHIKAGSEVMKQTNLTVVTAEGALYSFLIDYLNDPQQLNVHVADMHIPFKAEVIFSDGGNEGRVQSNAALVAVKQRSIKGRSDNQYDIGMSLNGLYIANDVLYFQIELKNSSNINYGIDQFRFYQRDKKQAKRTASQELELKPLYLSGNAKNIAGNSRQIVVAALEKFTIPDKKELIIELMEHNGGRHLQIRIKNSHLIKAVLL